MIQAHTFDAWTAAGARATPAFRYALVLSGFSAPLFLWLAGVAVSLSADATVRRGGSRTAGTEGVVWRGVQLFVLAFLFRLQAFVVTPGSDPSAILRVDILNVMGPAIVMAGLLWGLCRNPALSVGAFTLATVAVAMLSPVIPVLPSVDALPSAIQWYVRPAGEHTTFTLFPWIGFVLGGSAQGLLLTRVRRSSEGQLQLRFAMAGIALLAFGAVTASGPALYTRSSFWTNSPAFFAVRTGVLLLALPSLYFITAEVGRATPALRTLERLGRSSLFVYWIHVEMVYGYLTWPLHRALPLPGTVAAACIFAGLMYAAVLVKEQIGSGPLRRLTAARQAAA